MKFTVFENSKSSKKGHPVLYKMEKKSKTVFENRKSENVKKGRFLYKTTLSSNNVNVNVNKSHRPGHHIAKSQKCKMSKVKDFCLSLLDV